MASRIVTFNAKSDSIDPGVCIFDHNGNKLGQNASLNYPNKCWGSAIHIHDGTAKVRVATEQQHPKSKGGGNIWEIVIGGDNQVYGETLLEKSWTLCRSVARFRDSSILINESVWIMFPGGALTKLRAGSDWKRNRGCAVHDADLYVVTGKKNIWHIPLGNWDKGVDLDPVNLASVDHDPNFIAVDPLKPNLLYIGGTAIYQLDLNNNDVKHCTQDSSGSEGASYSVDDDIGGAITTDGRTSHLWFRSNGNLRSLNITGGGNLTNRGLQFPVSEKYDIQPNGIGPV